MYLYLYMRAICYRIGYQGTKPCTNSVEVHSSTGIQWMVYMGGCWFIVAPWFWLLRDVHSPCVVVNPFSPCFGTFQKNFLTFNCLCLFELANRAKSLHDESPLVGFTGGSSPTAFYWRIYPVSLSTITMSLTEISDWIKYATIACAIGPSVNSLPN